MRPACLLVPIVALAAALATGCGSSNDTTSATGPSGRAKTSAGSAGAPLGASAKSCGDTTVAGTQQLRVTGIGCDVGRGVVAHWAGKPACSRPAGASRYACTIDDDYRCLGAAAEQGIAVSCAGPGRSISFVARRG